MGHAISHAGGDRADGATETSQGRLGDGGPTANRVARSLEGAVRRVKLQSPRGSRIL